MEDKKCRHCGGDNLKLHSHSCSGNPVYHCLDCGKYFCLNPRHSSTCKCIDCGTEFYGTYRLRCDKCKEKRNKEQAIKYKGKKKSSVPKERKRRKSKYVQECPRCHGFSTRRGGISYPSYVFYCLDCKRSFCVRLEGKEKKAKPPKPQKIKVSDRIKITEPLIEFFECICCGNIKSRGEFNLLRNGKPRNGICKECGRDKKNAYRISKYGLPLSVFNNYLQKQNNKCAICERDLMDETGIMIDHCHKSGKVRGILCRNCNFMIGFGNDDINVLKSAINYLIEATFV